MFRKLIATITLLACATFVYSQNLRPQPHPAKDETVSRVQYDKLRTPQSEVEDAILFLSKLPKEDAQYIRFFSTYAIPTDRRDNAVLTLSFILHSLVGLDRNNPDSGNAGAYYPLA